MDINLLYTAINTIGTDESPRGFLLIIHKINVDKDFYAKKKFQNETDFRIINSNDDIILYKNKMEKKQNLNKISDEESDLKDKEKLFVEVNEPFENLLNMILSYLLVKDRALKMSTEAVQYYKGIYINY